MVGNPYAVNLEKGGDQIPFLFFGAGGNDETRFWLYNARFNEALSRTDNGLFIANVPFKKHPYIQSGRIDDNMGGFDFSHPVYPLMYG